MVSVVHMKHHYVMFQTNEISNECLETGTSSSKTNFQDGVPHEERLNFARKCIDKMGKSEVEKPPSSSKTKKEKLLSPTKVFSLEFCDLHMFVQYKNVNVRQMYFRLKVHLTPKYFLR